jgi:type II restriction enzyme
MSDKRDFDKWLAGFTDTIASYTYYSDFPKIIKNTEAIKIQLNILNSLIGSKNIEEDFIAIAKAYPEILECIPILLAVREKEITATDRDGKVRYDFATHALPLQKYAEFMRKTGLFDVISNHIVNNLVDYVFGVETGLDSNARKNRGGNIMEDLVEQFIKETGYTYYSQVTTADIRKRWNIDITQTSINSKAPKQFDFVVESRGNIYAFEVNFYASSGSKLNETARSYKMLTEELANIRRFKFVWVTDGAGWNSAKNNLRETFDVLDNIYSIKDLKEGALKKLFNGGE